ncbi:MAG: ferredoxin [Bacillales bacterium]|jgi:ferredoxin|nr:ferredoxin [Bacillales bacterium]
MAKIKVDRDACIGCGACVAIAEGVFDLDDEGKATVVGEGSAQEAIDSCPVGAISEE